MVIISATVTEIYANPTAPNGKSVRISARRRLIAHYCRVIFSKLIIKVWYWPSGLLPFSRRVVNIIERTIFMKQLEFSVHIPQVSRNSIPSPKKSRLGPWFRALSSVVCKTNLKSQIVCYKMIDWSGSVSALPNNNNNNIWIVVWEPWSWIEIREPFVRQVTRLRKNILGDFRTTPILDVIFRWKHRKYHKSEILNIRRTVQTEVR